MMHRRLFLKNTLAAVPPMLLMPSAFAAANWDNVHPDGNQLQELTTKLLEKWCQGLLAHQTNSPGNKEIHGGIYSPGDDIYLGRSADAIYPFLWMAKHTNDNKYLEAALKVYDWEQHNCWSEELGCWYNDANRPESWKGITVFAAMTKLEAILHYPDLLGEERVQEWKNRLYRVSDFIYRTIGIDFGNINYPATATLALFQLGELFQEDKYIKKAEEIANGLLHYFTPDGLFFGEGGREGNAEGQYPIDLGYNVEESLPAMAIYAKLSGNEALASKVFESMKAHLEFMLPNGAWDNSWGTRSFKWTLWGSRTSDGCHAGYNTFADRAPIFAEAVYRNLSILDACTFNNLLQSGPHEFIEGVAPSIHHTFNHAKSLVNLLHTKTKQIDFPKNELPREKEYGIIKFDSNNTILFSKGPWRGTVTAYNVGYKTEINGHASGGALTLLFHMQQDMVSAASMTEYQRWERFNMLDESKVENFMNLTPRLELTLDEQRVYRNISDHHAEITSTESEQELMISTTSRLVDGENRAPETGTPKVYLDYRVKKDVFSLEIALDKPIVKGKLRFIFPVICSAQEEIELSRISLKCIKETGTLTVLSNYPIETTILESQRVYNFVPGLQAFPLIIDCAEIHDKKLVLTFSV